MDYTELVAYDELLKKRIVEMAKYSTCSWDYSLAIAKSIEVRIELENLRRLTPKPEDRI